MLSPQGVNNAVAKKMTFRCTPRANVAATDSLGIRQLDISQEQSGSDRINGGRKVFRIGLLV